MRRSLHPLARLRVAVDAQRVDVDGVAVWLLGTIAGFVPDAARVQGAFEATTPRALALGVPPEDVEGLRTLAADPDVELPPLDPGTERLFEWLAPFGETRIPSPDLEAAFRAADAADVPVEALDLDDEAHADVFIQANKFRHVVQANRVQRKLMKEDFGGHASATELVLAWDAFQNRLPSLQAVEAAREAHMARRLREVAAGLDGGAVLAVVPVARLAGVLEHLRQDPPPATPDSQP